MSSHGTTAACWQGVRVGRRSLVGVLLAIVVVVCLAVPARAETRPEPLLVDLSTHRIEIDSSFTGTSLLLFGATDRVGDVIVTLRGPERAVVVRRKERQAGIWINRDAVAFRDVPQFYAVAASRPPEVLLGTDALNLHQVGTRHVLLNPVWRKTEDEADVFREALRRVWAGEALFPDDTGRVTFIDANLFRATIDIPANVPTGDYVAEIFLISDGELVSSKTTPLTVEKSGLSAEIWAFANSAGALYALIAIAAALVAGWIGSVVFRKV